MHLILAMPPVKNFLSYYMKEDYTLKKKLSIL